jgi:hypothetical protein
VSPRLSRLRAKTSFQPWKAPDALRAGDSPERASAR